jgi:hypothetical protein
MYGVTRLKKKKQHFMIGFKKFKLLLMETPALKILDEVADINCR